MRPDSRANIAGKHNVNATHTHRARLAALFYAVVEQTFIDLHDPRHRADAERFFDADHASHRAWICELIDLPEDALQRLYDKAQSKGLLAARPPTKRASAKPS